MSKLKFYPKSHTYKIGKTKLDSVTTFVGQFFDPFDAKGIARKLASYPYNKANKRGVRYWLNEWKNSREYGTLVHKEIEYIINSGNDIYYKEPHTRKALQSLEELQRNNPFISLTPELQVYDEELLLAGTIDLVLTNLKTGKISLADWKTNKKISNKSYDGKVGILPPTRGMDDCNLNKYKLQLSLYAYIMERKGCQIDKLYIIHLSDKGYKEIEVPYLREEVEKMLRYDGRLSVTDFNDMGGE